ncbi:hypothetical protein AC249_AIPGENE20376 [Exaiptasia diaphana]|nr:hypothetical protein AC249_AIPGENE20376 [Exaiptasia diaphana]
MQLCTKNLPVSLLEQARPSDRIETITLDDDLHFFEEDENMPKAETDTDAEATVSLLEQARPSDRIETITLDDDLHFFEEDENMPKAETDTDAEATGVVDNDGEQCSWVLYNKLNKPDESQELIWKGHLTQFGLTKFRPFQQQAIHAVELGMDSIIIQPRPCARCSCTTALQNV